MPTTQRKALERKVAEGLTRLRQRDALLNAVKRGRDARAETVSRLPGKDAFRSEVRAIKERCVSQLDDLQAKFTKNAERRGARVYLAETGEDACRYVLNLAKLRKAQLITKSKSLTTEEIHLSQPLAEAGIEVVETDLGERIIQMAGELPYHLVFPAVHKTAEQVADLFSKATGEDVTSDLSDIMALMRRTLRPVFLNADIGITGANVAIAETGAVVIETNEGNGRLVSSVPPVQVCVMGLEKIVDTVDDALQMILAHPVSATGQILTTYVSFMSGRASLGPEEDRELHIVILDNGRRAMREDPWYREALHCIRCGACMNICPTYGVLGGHIFGHIYPGPIGIPWTTNIHGLDKAAGFTDLCISCGLCREICPADIDIPMMIVKSKHEALALERQPLVNKVLMSSDTIAKIACATTPVSNFVMTSRLARMVAEKVLGLDRRREPPRFQRRTLRKKVEVAAQRSTPTGDLRVAFFTDYFAEFIKPEIALSAIQLCLDAGATLEIPKQRSSGYPFISYGDLPRARKRAEYNVNRFYPLARDGYTIISTEPTAVYALKFIYPKLLDFSEASRLVAEAAFELFEFLQRLREDGRLLFPPQITDARKFGLHLPCHQRALTHGRATLGFLRSLGYDVHVVETGTCCGMAGTFGMKKGALGMDLSLAVGERLFDLFHENDIDAILSESNVCTMQLRDGTETEILHPVELIKKR